MRIPLSIKILSLCLISFFIWANEAVCQSDSAFFYGYGQNKIAYVRKLELKQPVFKSAYLLVNDSTKLMPEQVWCYQTREGYFQKFMDYAQNNVVWYKREEKGKLNVYSTKITTQTYNSVIGTSYGPGVNYSTTTVYYFENPHKGLETIEYDNLRPYLERNPVSMASLESGRRISSTKSTLYVAGIGMFAIGGIMTLAGASSNSSSKSAKPLMLLGGITCFIPLTLPLPAQKYREAITIYNQAEAQKAAQPAE